MDFFRPFLSIRNYCQDIQTLTRGRGNKRPLQIVDFEKKQGGREKREKKWQGGGKMGEEKSKKWVKLLILEENFEFLA